MRFLFDENLPRSLVSRLSDIHPDSLSVLDLGLAGCSDHDIWAEAKSRGLAIATKDSDFVDRLFLDGPPPKVIWLKLGNCPVSAIETVFRQNAGLLTALEASDEYGLLVLPTGLLL
jgi:predicted nuclease of predicted toxin-antitoxin system